MSASAGRVSAAKVIHADKPSMLLRKPGSFVIQVNRIMIDGYCAHHG